MTELGASCRRILSRGDTEHLQTDRWRQRRHLWRDGAFRRRHDRELPYADQVRLHDAHASNLFPSRNPHTWTSFHAYGHKLLLWSLMCRPFLRGAWVLAFLVYAIVSAALAPAGTSVMSHIGGFVCGLFPAFLFLPKPVS